MVNFGLLTSEIRRRVWGTPANFNGLRVLAALLHSILVVGVSQTAALNRGRRGGAAITLGIGPHSTLYSIIIKESMPERSHSFAAWSTKLLSMCVLASSNGQTARAHAERAHAETASVTPASAALYVPGTMNYTGTMRIVV